jgi:hypothetical protein
MSDPLALGGKTHVTSIAALAHELGMGQAKLWAIMPKGPPKGPNGYDVMEWRLFIERDKASRKPAASTGGPVDLDAKRAAKLDEEVSILRIRREILACRVVEWDRVEQIQRDTLQTVRSVIDGFETRVALELEGKSGAEIRAAWRGVADELLANMREAFGRWRDGLPDEVQAAEAARPAEQLVRTEEGA